jgi:anti-sigma factor RsiW
MSMAHHQVFQRMIDESLAGQLSAERELSLSEHLATCAPCQEYLSASNRVIAGLGGFSFEVNPTLNAGVLAVLKLHHSEASRQHNVQFKVGAAFGVALCLSIAGSALVYQAARLLTAPMHFEAAQVQASVLVFWLLPSFCAALLLLAAPGRKRGIA